MVIPLFLIPILSGLIAQGLKPFFNRRTTLSRLNIPRYGGMPSAHTAFAVSLTTVTAFVTGLTSPTFALACGFLIYTLDDALRMRIFLGNYGKALTQLIRRLPTEERKAYPFVVPQLGHTLPEVTAGAILGFALSLIALYILPWSNL